MAALKTSEKRLLIGLGVAAFLMLNFWGWSFFQNELTRLDGDAKKLSNQLSVLKASQRRIAEARTFQETLAAHMKAYDSMDTRDTYLGNFVEKSADDMHLKLQKNNPLATEMPRAEDSAGFIKSGYQGEVIGEWKDVMEFVRQLQVPTEFRFVKSLNLSVQKSEAQDGDSELRCQFVLQKWWPLSSEEIASKKLESGATPAERTPAGAVSNGNDATAPKPAVVEAGSASNPTSANGTPVSVPAAPAKPPVQ